VIAEANVNRVHDGIVTFSSYNIGARLILHERREHRRGVMADPDHPLNEVVSNSSSESIRPAGTYFHRRC
jgi:hypothetical protein